MAARGSPKTDGAGVSSVFALEGEAQAVADRLPELLLDALRVANTVTHGIHGRRRAGTGETFWQFRQFIPASDPAAVVDWRRSASVSGRRPILSGCGPTSRPPWPFAVISPRSASAIGPWS